MCEVGYFTSVTVRFLLWDGAEMNEATVYFRIITTYEWSDWSKP
jgi:hypothetical protein